ncbi:MAG: helix-turn-helix domain-containing protein [Treponema sp.]|jgi:transcriptional regulator with XRE-family HTH domain|nr:helix-turn-helix domain-containing protein [Treponema sp.]
MSVSVIERLKAVRHTLNVSQKVFAKAIFISTSYYACIETGHRKIKDTLLDSISKIYNVNKEWLLTGKGGMFDTEPPDVKQEELIGIFKRLNGHFQGYILDQVRHLDKIQKKELREKN